MTLRDHSRIVAVPDRSGHAPPRFGYAPSCSVSKKRREVGLKMERVGLEVSVEILYNSMRPVFNYSVLRTLTPATEYLVKSSERGSAPCLPNHTSYNSGPSRVEPRHRSSMGWETGQSAVEPGAGIGFVPHPSRAGLWASRRYRHPHIHGYPYT